MKTVEVLVIHIKEQLTIVTVTLCPDINTIYTIIAVSRKYKSGLDDAKPTIIFKFENEHAVPEETLLPVKP